jgi:hypothetical protein
MFLHIHRFIVLILGWSISWLCTTVIELLPWLISPDCLLNLVCPRSFVWVSTENGYVESSIAGPLAIHNLHSWRWNKRSITFAFRSVWFAVIVFFIWLFMDSTKLLTFTLEFRRIGRAWVCVVSVASCFLRFWNWELSILRCPKIYLAIVFGGLRSHSRSCEAAPEFSSLPLSSSELFAEIIRRIVLFKVGRLTQVRSLTY